MELTNKVNRYTAEIPTYTSAMKHSHKKNSFATIKIAVTEYSAALCFISRSNPFMRGLAHIRSTIAEMNRIAAMPKTQPKIAQNHIFSFENS